MDTLHSFRLPVAVAATLLLAACDGGSDAPPPGLPMLFALEAGASLAENGQTLDCHVNYIVELERETQRTSAFVEYAGTMGGEAGRTILNPDGSGVSLVGDAFSRVIVRLTLPNSVTITSVGLPPPNDPPNFWDGVANFSGREAPGDLISGDWQCLPFYTVIGGVDDSVMIASGTWFTTPL